MKHASESRWMRRTKAKISRLVILVVTEADGEASCSLPCFSSLTAVAVVVGELHLWAPGEFIIKELMVDLSIANCQVAGMAEALRKANHIWEHVSNVRLQIKNPMGSRA